MLAALLPSRSADARGQVHETNAALRGVLVLATRPTRPEGLDATLREEAFVAVRNREGENGVGHEPGCAEWCGGTLWKWRQESGILEVTPLSPEPYHMILDRMDQNPGAKVLFSLACVVVIVFGLRYAAPILLPSALALFLAILSLPAMIWLRNRRVPKGLAIVIPVLLNVAVVVLLILVASSSVSELQRALPNYLVTLNNLQIAGVEWFEARTDVVLSEYMNTDLINPAAILGFAGGAVGRIAQILGMTFLVFLIMAFMLSEATVFPAKFRYLTQREAIEEDRLAKVVTEVQTYLGIKTVISLATGLILGTWAWVMGLDFPVLLGLTAFLLNYVPTVGSIIAAIPAILLSIILIGSAGHAIAVGLGYMTVNTLFGNILEPTLMGRRLGLSTLVVILSLLFWGWAWGPMGALISVPLTVIVKIWLENTTDLRWVAVLLDKNPPPGEPALAEAGD